MSHCPQILEAVGMISSFLGGSLNILSVKQYSWSNSWVPGTGGGAATEDKEASGAMKESLGRTLLVNVWCPAAGWVGVEEGT